MITEKFINILNVVGRRKTSVAKVKIESGSGKILINNVDFDLYFATRVEEKKKVLLPLILTKFNNQYDITIFVRGGGMSSQLEAIKLGISRALLLMNGEYRDILKKNLLIKRDARIKERRKYGLKKARKAPQYSKR